MENILKQLSISNHHHGACIGGDSWIETKDQGTIKSVNPSNGQVIATVHKCSEADYEKVITASSEAFKEWRKA
jgi:acyl-CoA reductase-like NAD-dependent aldehyde dehydrogenase